MHEDPTARRSRLRLAGFLSFMGALHFVAPKQFDRIIPKWMPGRARTWTHLSGLAELTSAALLARPATKRAGGWCAAATLVAVYPANVQMVIDSHRDRARAPVRAGLWLRLPMQFPMIAWAVKQTRV